MVLGGARVHQVHRPPLELVRADFLQRLRAPNITGRADDFVGTEVAVKRVAQAALHKIDREIGDVNTVPQCRPKSERIFRP